MQAPFVMFIWTIGVIGVCFVVWVHGECTFCSKTGSNSFFSFDLSSLPNTSFTLKDSHDADYFIGSPCQNINNLPFPTCCGHTLHTPMVEGIDNCNIIGLLASNSTITLLDDGASGFNLSIPGSGPPSSTCGNPVNPPNYGRRGATYQFLCDHSVPVTNGPESVIREIGCEYAVTWRHPAACGVAASSCSTPIPPPPAMPAPQQPCTPKWNPTWDMRNSTILYACNTSGFLDLDLATRFGIQVIDWSNSKDVWVASHPMNDEELLTKQAELILERDPGVPGEAPKVWVYRNTIKALNWYTSVREKLDDGLHEEWFIKFKDYKGPSSNYSYNVYPCQYNECSGFYHDERRTPAYPSGDGSCPTFCNCSTNFNNPTPCGEYVFDHRNESFRDWFINEYMISNETLFHKPIAIGLGWLDDSLLQTGPTEMHSGFVNDTGFSLDEMRVMVAAYKETMNQLSKKVIDMGGYYWQLMQKSSPHVKDTKDIDLCTSTLREYCIPQPPQWQALQLYEVQPTDAIANATQYTAEFLLTRGPYAVLGYSWIDCNGTGWPFPSQWNQDYGVPSEACYETGQDTKIFQRNYSHATVAWNCNTGNGSIAMK